jgi:hypothetical protein
MLVFIFNKLFTIHAILHGSPVAANPDRDDVVGIILCISSYRVIL